MSGYKVRNYNLSYEMLLKAISKFNGFIPGAGVDNSLFKYSIGDDMTGDKQDANGQKTYMPGEQEVLSAIAPRVLDRTSGTFFLRDIMQSKATGLSAPPENLRSYMEVYHEAQGGGFFGVGNDYTKDIYNPGAYHMESKDIAEIESEMLAKTIGKKELLAAFKQNHIAEMNNKKGGPRPVKEAPVSISAVIGFLNPADLQSKLYVEPEKKGKKADKDEKAKKKKNEKKKFNYSARVLYDGSYSFVKSLVNKNPKLPHRFNAPSLGAIVLKHSKLNMGGKREQHLSTFFNAITPIEMSRATPYISITIMTEDFKNSKNPRPLNNISFMRFIKEENGAFVLDESIGLKNVSSKNSIASSEASDFKPPSAGIIKDHGYMDLFTAPQTMANANINNMADPSNLLPGFANSNGWKSSPVLEPIAPFLSLGELSVSISGTGFGIMASKVAGLKLTLHDRSRLKELAPLLATDKFASTKLIIEYGWNHPDGGPTSNNTIGQYLDGLKDVGVYQVHGSDYSFGSGNTVEIDVKLSCSGFNETKTVPAACGTVSPLFIFGDWINHAVDKILKEKEEKGASATEIKEVRQGLKIRQRTARSAIALIEFEKMKNFYNAITAEKEPNYKEILATTREILKISDFEIEDEKERTTQLDKNLMKAGMQESTAKHLSGKVEALAKDLTPDPFACSFITECLATEKIAASRLASEGLTYDFLYGQAFPGYSGKELNHIKSNHFVTMGKLIMSFIGHPLATSGLYDEVQVLFYPMNHQAAGARKHTTASFPIEFERLKKKMDEKIRNNARMTVHSFFAVLESIVRDRSSWAYGLNGVYTDLDEWKKLKDEKQKLTISKDWAKKQGRVETAKDDEKVLKEYEAELRKQKEKMLGTKLKKIYNEDSVRLPAEEKFVRPNLSMFFEVIPAIDTNTWEDLNLSAFAKEMLTPGPKEGLSNGLLDKTILRVHIFDEEAVSSPTITALKSTLEEGNAKYILGGIKKNDPAIQNLFKIKPKNTEDAQNKVQEVIAKASFGEIKQFLKRQYPGLTYGASNSVVQNISISGNTSGALANVLMVEAYGQHKKGVTAASKEPNSFEDVMMFPATITMNMMGMPMIAMGENIFIDFGTDTSLDNIYNVKSIRHSLKSGEFTTFVELVASNQGAVRSFRTQLQRRTKKLSGIVEEKKKK